MDWSDYSFVVRSKLRVAILKSLQSSQKTPTQLKIELKKSITLISRYLTQLKNRDLIHCLTKDERMWKLYTLTEKGENMLKQIKS